MDTLNIFETIQFLQLKMRGLQCAEPCHVISDPTLTAMAVAWPDAFRIADLLEAQRGSTSHFRINTLSFTF